VAEGLKKLPAAFFRTEAGNEPVRNWLIGLDAEDRKIIGDDIRDCEFAWPIGMPLCRSLKGYAGLWEIRSNLPSNRIARVIFCIHDGAMVLLHGFIKKAQKTPEKEIEVAVARRKGLKR
jgi:phage-related protein